MAEELREGTRDGYGRALFELAEKDRNVVALDCDLGRSTRSFRISEADPDRFIELGIAEQDMISTAAGLASEGKIVFANSFAVFLTGRAYDQIRQQVSLAGTNVKLCGSSAGITQGPDGATHQSVTDLSLMRGLPNMTVLVPADARQAELAVRAAHRKEGPFYIRLSRMLTGLLTGENADFELGRAQLLRAGTDVALLGTGPILQEVLVAAEHLNRVGLSAGVYNFHTIKPLDVNCLRKIFGDHRLVITVEEHSIIGGLGSAVAEMLAELRDQKKKPLLQRLGVQDTFGESGTAEELLKLHGLDGVSICAAVQQIYREVIR